MSKQELRRTAALQHGYFRTRQALDVGLSRTNLVDAVRSGEIESIAYGLYRFAHYPLSTDDDLHEIQTIAPDGTFSHETALALFGLSDVLPRTVHFTVPPASGFKHRPGLTVHHARLGPDERVLRAGLWLTSPLRTLIDAARGGSDPEQLLMAATQALDSAILPPDDLPKLAGRYPYNMLETR